MGCFRRGLPSESEVHVHLQPFFLAGLLKGFGQPKAAWGRGLTSRFKGG